MVWAVAAAASPSSVFPTSSLSSASASLPSSSSSLPHAMSSAAAVAVGATASHRAPRCRSAGLTSERFILGLGPGQTKPNLGPNTNPNPATPAGAPGSSLAGSGSGSTLTGSGSASGPHESSRSAAWACGGHAIVVWWHEEWQLPCRTSSATPARARGAGPQPGWLAGHGTGLHKGGGGAPWPSSSSNADAARVQFSLPVPAPAAPAVLSLPRSQDLRASGAAPLELGQAQGQGQVGVLRPVLLVSRASFNSGRAFSDHPEQQRPQQQQQQQQQGGLLNVSSLARVSQAVVEGAASPSSLPGAAGGAGPVYGSASVVGPQRLSPVERIQGSFTVS